MTRLILGGVPDIQKKTVKEYVPWEMSYPEEFKTYTIDKYRIPPEAVFTQPADVSGAFWTYTWTWYELEI